MKTLEKNLPGPATNSATSRIESVDNQPKSEEGKNSPDTRRLWLRRTFVWLLGVVSTVLAGTLTQFVTPYVLGGEDFEHAAGPWVNTDQSAVLAFPEAFGDKIWLSVGTSGYWLEVKSYDGPRFSGQLFCVGHRAPIGDFSGVKSHRNSTNIIDLTLRYLGDGYKELEFEKAI